MNKNKMKRRERVMGWTKASHKGAKIYFSGDKPVRSGGSLKRKKKCKFNKGVHEFEKIGEGNLWSWRWFQYKCKNCGKLSHKPRNELQEKAQA